MCASPPLWFFTTSGAWARRRVVAVTLPACLPACLKTSRLLKWDNAKERFLCLCLHRRTTHTRLNPRQYELRANTNAEPFNSSFRRGGNETPAANKECSEDRGRRCVVCFKNNHRRAKNKFNFKTIPVSRPLKGQDYDERPESHDVRLAR